MDTPTSLGNNIKKIRLAHELTQLQLAEIARVSDKAVSSWEAGRSTPRIPAVERIAKHFDIPVSMLYQDDSAELDTLLEWREVIQIPGMPELIEAAKAASEDDLRLAAKILERMTPIQPKP